MKTFALGGRFVAVVAAWLTLAVASWAADTVKLVKGSLQGHVVNMTPDHVELETGAGKNRHHPPHFGGLNDADRHMRQGVH